MCKGSRKKVIQPPRRGGGGKGLATLKKELFEALKKFTMQPAAHCRGLEYICFTVFQERVTHFI